jgi:hypothetical protein
MRRALALTAALVLALAPLASAAALRYTANAQAVTETSAEVTFTDNRSGGTALEFRARYITITNTGSNELFFDYGDTTATTDDTRLDAGETVNIGPPDQVTSGDGWSGIGIVASASEATTARIVATR